MGADVKTAVNVRIKSGRRISEHGDEVQLGSCI